MLRSLLVVAALRRTVTSLLAANDGVLTRDLTGWDWGRAGIIVGAAVVLAELVRRLLARAVTRGDDEAPGGGLVGRLSAVLIVVVGVIYAMSVLQVRLTPLLGALGIGGIALAFALQDILANFLAGILLQTRRPFRRGDQVMTNGYEGTVEDVNLRTVVLRTYDGHRAFVPNSMVLREPIVNLTARGVRRTSLTVGVGYGADLERARSTIAAAVGSVEGVREHPAPEVFVEAFADSSVNLAVRFWHGPRVDAMWKVRDAVAVAVKRSLDEAGIEIPFPQRTVWFARESSGDEGRVDTAGTADPQSRSVTTRRRGGQRRGGDVPR